MIIYDNADGQLQSSSEMITQGLGTQDLFKRIWISCLSGRLALRDKHVVSNSECLKDSLYGDESVTFVAFGNATAEVIARVLIPLCYWLGLVWLIENPVSRHIISLMDGMEASLLW